MVIKPGFGTFCSVGRCQVLLENEISISCKHLSIRKHDALYNVLTDDCIDFRLEKYSESTPADDMVPQIITESGNFTLDFKQLGFCALHSSSRLLDLKDADFGVRRVFATCPCCGGCQSLV